ncbi:hypothetical protein [Actinoplanes sp. NPDC048796]|uniref:hypothetical protein n=1 Tax=Actinoplanes sp. NPDC048796 TaxID=3155640 RepID=UPI0033F05F75
MTTYRSRGFLLVFPLMMVATVALPVAALFVDTGPWWAEALFLLIAIPVGWWYVAVRLVYRMDLTGDALVLRAALARYRVPLADLAEIGGPEHTNTNRVVRRDGRVWSVLAGDGLVAFADQVGRAAPHVRVRISDWRRRMEG